MSVRLPDLAPDHQYARAIAAKVLLCLFVVAGVFVAQPSGATQVERSAIVGRLRHGGEPVAGVHIEVQRAGRHIGQDSTDERGRFRIPVEPGLYRVALDASTLPAGVALARGAPRVLERVVVRQGREKVVLFRLGERPSDGRSAPARRMATLVLAGLRLGAIVAVAAVGLTLVFGTTGIINLAHGELVTFGAIAAWYLNHLGIPLAAAGLLAAGAGALLGRVLDLALWSPLRRRGIDLNTVMVISIGLSLVLRNVYLLVFGAGTRAYRDYAAQPPWIVLGVRVQPKSVAIIGLATVALLGVGWLLRSSRPGRAMRAVGDEAPLAAASGVDVGQVVAQLWMLAGALAAAGGVLLGVIEGVQWDMGLRALLVMAAAVVLGGLGSPTGALVGGLSVGLATELSTYWLTSELQLVVALVILVAILLVRPTGILGARSATP